MLFCLVLGWVLSYMYSRGFGANHQLDALFIKVAFLTALPIPYIHDV